MPRYVYRCQKCAHEWEQKESFDSPTTKKCPKCKGKSGRVFFPPLIRFIGDGWASSSKG